MGRHMSLAAQFLALQLLIGLLVLFAVAGVSLAQSAREFRDVEGRRARDIEENVAATGLVRSVVLAWGWTESRAVRVEQARAYSGDSDVTIATADRRIIASTNHGAVDGVLALYGSTVLKGTSWTGTVADQGVRSVA